MNTQKSILTTYSRLARLEFGEDAYVTLAVDIVAPCYVAYVKWLLNDAQKRGIKIWKTKALLRLMKI